MMASVVCLSKIIEHYGHARQKHPYFCDRVNPTGLEEMPARVKEYISLHLSELRATIVGEEKNGTLGWGILLNCEVWEVYEALASGNNEQAEEELYDCVAILLRVIDVLRGRQHLGKKFPPARCERDNKKGKTMPEFTKYIRCHSVKARPMTRGEYNTYRGWAIPENENPADEGYLVVYPDGYESWCPKAQFEEAGRPIDGMTFGIAIDACRYKGAKIQRANWNGNGQYVRYEECLASEDGKLHVDPQDAPGMVESKCFVFHFVNRKGETGIQVGWLASQADMAADDWRIVE